MQVFGLNYNATHTRLQEVYYHNFGDISLRNGPLPASSENAYINTTKVSTASARRHHRADRSAGGLRGRLEAIMTSAVDRGDGPAGIAPSHLWHSHRRKAGGGKGRPSSAGTAAAASKSGGGGSVRQLPPARPPALVT